MQTTPKQRITKLEAEIKALEKQQALLERQA